jgi:beta-lactamase class D
MSHSDEYASKEQTQSAQYTFKINTSIIGMAMHTFRGKVECTFKYKQDIRWHTHQ